MAQATVFVDDAVLGRLPPVCVKDGFPTDDVLTLHAQVGNGNGLGVAWLLLLAGPLGWIGLLFVALSRRSGDTLSVQLPFSEAAYERLRQAKRAAMGFGVVAAGLVIGALFALGHHRALLAAVLGGVCALAIVQWARSVVRVQSCTVGVSLDASRRWVTLYRVHPTFAQNVRPRPEASLYG